MHWVKPFESFIVSRLPSSKRVDAQGRMDLFFTSIYQSLRGQGLLQKVHT